MGFAARSLRDLSVALGVTSGPDGHDPEIVPIVPRRDTRGHGRPPRIAWTDTLPGLPCAAEIRRGIRDLAQSYADAKWIVEPAVPPGLDAAGTAVTYGTIMGAEIASTLPDGAGGAGDDGTAAADPFTLGYLRGRRASSRVYLDALRARSRLAAAFEQFLSSWDVWMCPVAPTVAPHHTAGRPPVRVGDDVLPYVAQGWFCLPASLTHHPAVTVPIGLTSEGLPYSVQFVGRLWHDHALLSMAERLTAAVPRLPCRSDPPLARDWQPAVAIAPAICGSVTPVNRGEPTCNP